MNLVAPTLRLAYLRVFGGTATKGKRAARAVALVLLVGLVEGLAVWQTQRQATANETASALIPPVVTILVYLAGGSIVLLSVATRDSSGSTRRAFMTLPLSRIGMVVLEWIPVFSTAIVLLGLTVAPALSALVAARYPLGGAISLLSAALGTGAATAGLLLAAVAALLRDSAWNPVRYPLTMLIWAATVAAGLWRSFAQDGTGGSTSGDALLLLPPLVREAGLGTVLEPWVGVVSGVGAMLVVGAVVPWSLSRRLTERRRLIRWSWKGGKRSSLFTGEMVYSTRDTTLVANAVAAEVLVLGLCVLLALVPPLLRAPLLAPTITAAACLVGSVVRQHRSLFPTARPTQQLINLEATPWAARQFSIGLTWFAVLFAPPLATALWLGMPPGPTWGAWAAAASTSFAVCTLVGWLLPFPLDNAPGQLLISVATVAAAGALSAFTVELCVTSPLLALALCSSAVLASLVTAVAAERRRWGAF